MPDWLPACEAVDRIDLGAVFLAVFLQRTETAGYSACLEAEVKYFAEYVSAWCSAGYMPTTTSHPPLKQACYQIHGSSLAIMHLPTCHSKFPNHVKYTHQQQKHHTCIDFAEYKLISRIR
jgi:hypothetical protein